MIPVLIAEGIEKEQTEVRCWDGWDPRIHPPHTHTLLGRVGLWGRWEESRGLRWKGMEEVK